MNMKQTMCALVLLCSGMSVASANHMTETEYTNTLIALGVCNAVGTIVDDTDGGYALIYRAHVIIYDSVAEELVPTEKHNWNQFVVGVIGTLEAVSVERVNELVDGCNEYIGTSFSYREQE